MDKLMFFLIEDNNLLGKYNTIQDNLSTDIKKKINSRSLQNKTILKTKIKSHGDEVKDLYGKEIPIVDFDYTCLALISLDSALKKDKNSYPQVFLRECNYLEKVVVRHINDNMSGSPSSDESDKE